MQRHTECCEVLQGGGRVELTAVIALHASGQLPSSSRPYSRTHPHQRRGVLQHGGKGNYVEGGVRVFQRLQKRSCVPASPVKGSTPRPQQQMLSDFFPGAPGVQVTKPICSDIFDQGDREPMQGSSSQSIRMQSLVPYSCVYQ